MEGALEVELRSDGEADGGFRSTIGAGVPGILRSCSDGIEEEPMEDKDSVRMEGVTGV